MNWFKPMVIGTVLVSVAFPLAGFAEDATAAKPLKLFGRIEQLSQEEGAHLPPKMVPQTPKMDTTQEHLSGTIAHSFPIECLGTWIGELTISSFDADKSFYQFDRREAEQQEKLLAPGLKGNCLLSFITTKDKRTEAAPTEVIFNGEKIAGAPALYNLHLGDLNSGKGLTGNELNSSLVSNTLRELAENVWEQETVTSNVDRNPRTGKVKKDYTENVLRITRIDREHLYVQAATVSYGGTAKFQNKVLLYGTLSKKSN